MPEMRKVDSERKSSFYNPFKDSWKSRTFSSKSEK